MRWFVTLLLVGCWESSTPTGPDPVVFTDASVGDARAKCSNSPGGSPCCHGAMDCRVVSACGGTCQVCSFCSGGVWGPENGDDCHFGPCADRDTGIAEPELAAAPVFDPPPGSYSGIVTVKLSTGSVGASVFYTTDGTNPNPSSPRYTAPLTLTMTTTLKAIAAAPGWRPSPIATGVYVVTMADASDDG